MIKRFAWRWCRKSKSCDENDVALIRKFQKTAKKCAKGPSPVKKKSVFMNTTSTWSGKARNRKIKMSQGQKRNFKIYRKAREPCAPCLTKFAEWRAMILHCKRTYAHSALIVREFFGTQFQNSAGTPATFVFDLQMQTCAPRVDFGDCDNNSKVNDIAAAAINRKRLPTVLLAMEEVKPVYSV